MICLAKIVAVKGIKGDVKVKSFTVDSSSLMNYKTFYDKTGTRKIPLTILRPEKDYFLAHIDGVKSREEAFLYKGLELYVAREDLPDLNKDEFYYSDLIGLKAINLDTQKEGKVLAVRNYGAEDLLDIGGDEASVSELIPFRNQYVPEINVKKGFLTYRSFVKDGKKEEEEDVA